MAVLILVLVLVAVAAIAVVVWLVLQQRRSRALQAQFGPEYDRTVQAVGDRGHAEQEHDMNVDALKQLPVMSIETGAKLGYVDDLFFDTAPLRVAALHVMAEGQAFLVPWNTVKTVGPDAIMVPDDAATHTLSSESSLASLPGIATMRTLKVVDEGGTFIGMVKELDVDPQSGVITQVDTHTGGVLGMGGTTTIIVAADIRSIGDEVLLTTVRSPEQKPVATTSA